MKVRSLHPWEVDIPRAAAIQARLRRRLVQRPLPHPIRRLAGADVAYDRRSDAVWAAVVVLDFPGLELVEIAEAAAAAPFPYVPGFLTFREGPVLVQAFRALRIAPDVVIFDGQGIAHPRRLGIAAHMGILLEIPAIGCAKRRLTGRHEDPGPRRGDRRPLWAGGPRGGRGARIGTVLRTREGVRPVYVSPGHLCDHRGAARIVLRAATGFRLPEPVRRAHARVTALRRGAG